ncbi:hypothetical protein L3V79_03195 [Thiotrichales bacterium 19S9-12]|nr:hypothetical protein [Thiotrichales bacterium 19S9-11]MCF6811366.1 hypothetical protein [Thiotrichales bacterium 19S9-12]
MAMTIIDRVLEATHIYKTMHKDSWWRSIGIARANGLEYILYQLILLTYKQQSRNTNQEKIHDIDKLLQSVINPPNIKDVISALSNKQTLKDILDPEDVSKIKALIPELNQKSIQMIHGFILGFIHENNEEMKAFANAAGINKLNDDTLEILNPTPNIICRVTNSLSWLSGSASQSETIQEKESTYSLLPTIKFMYFPILTPYQFPQWTDDIKPQLPSWENYICPTEVLGNGTKKSNGQKGFLTTFNDEAKQEFWIESQLVQYVSCLKDNTVKKALQIVNSPQMQDNDQYPYAARYAVYDKSNNNECFGFITLTDLISKINNGEIRVTEEQILSLINQILYVTSLYWLAGILHGDPNAGNLGVIIKGAPLVKSTDPIDQKQPTFELRVFDFGNANFVGRQKKDKGEDEIKTTEEIKPEERVSDFSYLLLNQSIYASEGVARSFASYIPFKNSIDEKHFPIYKLVRILLALKNKTLAPNIPHSEVEKVLKKPSELFINQLRYGHSDNPEVFNYFIENFMRVLKGNLYGPQQEKDPNTGQPIINFDDNFDINQGQVCEYNSEYKDIEPRIANLRKENEEIRANNRELRGGDGNDIATKNEALSAEHERLRAAELKPSDFYTEKILDEYETLKEENEKLKKANKELLDIKAENENLTEEIKALKEKLTNSSVTLHASQEQAEEQKTPEISPLQDASKEPSTHPPDDDIDPFKPLFSSCCSKDEEPQKNQPKVQLKIVSNTNQVTTLFDIKEDYKSDSNIFISCPTPNSTTKATNPNPIFSSAPSKFETEPQAIVKPKEKLESSNANNSGIFGSWGGLTSLFSSNSTATTKEITPE